MATAARRLGKVRRSSARGKATLGAATVLALVCTLFNPAPAVAATAQEKALAESLFKEGKALLSKDPTKACEKLAESQRLDPASGTALNLADCQEKLGRLATAFGTYQIAEELARERNNSGRVALIKKKLKSLEPKIPHLRLVASTPLPAGAVLSLDGTTLGAAAIGTELAVDPGEHRLEVRAPGFEPFVKELKIAEGASSEEECGPLKRLPAEAKPKAPKPSWPLPAFVATAGVAAVGLGFGIGAGVRAIDLGAVVSAECPENACTAAGLDALSEGDRFATASNVAFVLAGVFGAAATTFLVLEFVLEPSEVQLQVGISGGATEVGGTISGAF